MGLILMRPAHRSPEQRATLQAMRRLAPELEQSISLVERFAQMLRQRQPDALARWLSDAAASGIGAFKRFVTKLNQDLAAVRAALTVEWSQGQVEGQVTHLKLIRRQMYGRGSFDLVRKRVLHAA